MSRVIASSLDLAGVLTTDLSKALNGFRLTYATGDPLPSSDQLAATSVYMTPFISNEISVLVGSVWTRFTSSEISLSLASIIAGNNYDVFAYANASNVITLELSAAWASNVTRTDLVVRDAGVLVKSSDHTRRLLGTLRAISGGNGEDSRLNRLLVNVSNSRFTNDFTTDATGEWSTSFGGTEAMNGGNPVWIHSFLVAINEDTVTCMVAVNGKSGGVFDQFCGIGLDSSATSAADSQSSIWREDSAGASRAFFVTHYAGKPGNGYHTLQGLQGTSGGFSTATYIGAGYAGIITGVNR